MSLQIFFLSFPSLPLGPSEVSSSKVTTGSHLMGVGILVGFLLGEGVSGASVGGTLGGTVGAFVGDGVGATVGDGVGASDAGASVGALVVGRTLGVVGVGSGAQVFFVQGQGSGSEQPQFLQGQGSGLEHGQSFFFLQEQGAGLGAEQGHGSATGAGVALLQPQSASLGSPGIVKSLAIASCVSSPSLMSTMGISALVGSEVGAKEGARVVGGLVGCPAHIHSTMKSTQPYQLWSSALPLDHSNAKTSC